MKHDFEVANCLPYHVSKEGEEVCLIKGMLFNEVSQKQDARRIALSKKLSGIHGYGIVGNHAARTGEIDTISLIQTEDGSEEIHFTTKEVPCYCCNKVVRVLPPSAFYFKL